MSARSLDVGGAVDPSSAADRAIDRRRILGAIAEDKARHAELSYRIVRWLLDGFDVRRVVTEARCLGMRADGHPRRLARIVRGSTLSLDGFFTVFSVSRGVVPPADRARPPSVTTLRALRVHACYLHCRPGAISERCSTVRRCLCEVLLDPMTAAVDYDDGR
jgi:hypothetical protein